MKKIMIAVDFSENAFRACVYAATIAQKTGAVITLVHAIEPVADNLRQPFSLHDKFLAQLENDSLNDLKHVSFDLKKKFPELKIKIHSEYGTALTVLPEFIKKQKPDLVVMGTKGKTGFEKILYGSVASGMINRTTRPILIIPPQFKKRATDAIVLATNRFEKNTRYLRLVIELAGLFKAVIHIVIFIDTDIASAITLKKASDNLQKYLSQLKMKYTGVRFKTTLLKGRDFEPVIKEFLITKGADILTMFTYHKTVWQKLFGKSHTKKMLQQSGVPLLVIPAE